MRLAFNDEIHQYLAAMLEMAECRAEDRLGWLGPEAALGLCHLYVKTCASQIEHTVQFLVQDEYRGALIFLGYISNRRLGAKKLTACAHQLATFAASYFPEFNCILRQMALATMARAESLDEIDRKGVLMLAAATLPGFLVDYRRARRRLGAKTDRTIVIEATLHSRIITKTSLLESILATQ